jgi:hypothetical protein
MLLKFNWITRISIKIKGSGSKGVTKIPISVTTLGNVSITYTKSYAFHICLHAYKQNLKDYVKHHLQNRFKSLPWSLALFSKIQEKLTWRPLIKITIMYIYSSHSENQLTSPMKKFCDCGEFVFRSVNLYHIQQNPIPCHYINVEYGTFCLIHMTLKALNIRGSLTSIKG